MSFAGGGFSQSFPFVLWGRKIQSPHYITRYVPLGRGGVGERSVLCVVEKIVSTNELFIDDLHCKERERGGQS